VVSAANPAHVDDPNYHYSCALALRWAFRAAA
jgi:hypothetical protein